MKYVGRLVLVLQAALMAGWVHAVTVTVNGNGCGSTTLPVVIDTNGNITITTNDTTSCAPGGTVGTGPFTLTVNKAGNGSGTVTSSPTGIDCGSTCSASYDAGSSVQLTATPAEGSVFAGWSNGCSGTGSCSVTTNSNQSRTATFNVAGSTVACPTGVTCLERPWPIIVQETLSMKGNAVMAIKVNTTAAGVSGLLSTMFTTGATATREVALSTTPGDFAVGYRCLKTGLEVTSTSWQQQGTDRGACQVPANSPMWINIRFTNCPTTSSCSFYLKNN